MKFLTLIVLSTLSVFFTPSLVLAQENKEFASKIRRFVSG